MAQTVKNLPVMWETWVRSLDWEDPLEKGMKVESESEVAQSCLTLCQGLVPLRWGCALPSPNAPGKAPNHIHLGKMRPLPATASQGKSPVPP